MCFEKQYKKIGGEKYCLCRVLGTSQETALEPEGGVEIGAGDFHQEAGLGGGGRAHTSLFQL